MTLNDLKATPQFAALQPKQQAWVVAFCSNGGDAVAAARTSYSCQDDNSARVIANRNLKHTEMRRLTDAFLKIEPGSRKFTKDELLVRMSKKIAEEKVDDKVLLGLLTLYGKWEGFETEKAPAPSEPAVAEPDEAAARELLKELEQ